MITIDFLKNHPNCIPELANIWREELGKIWVPDIAIETIITKFSDHLNDDILPITFIALDGKKPVGMCSLRANDGIMLELTPWLGSLVVAKEYQQQGIGKILIEATINQAKKMNFDKIYLFTFDLTLPKYYNSLGWSIIKLSEFKGHAITVMELTC